MRVCNTYMPHFVYPDTWIAFAFWLYLNNPAVNFSIQIPVRVSDFSSSEYVSRSDVAGSHGSCRFHLLRNCRTAGPSI